MIEFSPCSQKWIWNVIAIRNPRCGSTSLWEHCGDFNLIKKYEKIFDDVLIKNKTYNGIFRCNHAKSQEVFNILGSRVREYLSFVSIRNPWDRIVSMYHGIHKIDLITLEKVKKIYNIQDQQLDNFENFCLLLKKFFDDGNKHFMFIQNQVEWIEGDFKPNYILIFENLQEDFKEMIDSHNIKHISNQLLHTNESAHRKNYHYYYNNKTKKIVEKIFEKDIDTFKYTY
jgi:hypothetical protein